jgi:hypothetical protein
MPRGKVYNGKDAIGLQVAKLKIKEVFRVDKVTYANCTCDCDLDKIHKIRLHDILLKKRKSCGCLKRTKEKVLLELPEKDRSVETRFWSGLLHRYTSGAKIRNLEFSLDLQQFKNLVLTNCYYCGQFNKGVSSIKIEGLKSKRQKTIDEWSSFHIQITGIDRLDSKVGYKLDNCVSCCSTCNQIKMDLTVDEFLEKVKLIYAKHF